MGPLTTSVNNNKYALTIICDLTKYLITVPMKTKSANEVAKAIFENCILKHGPMKSIRTDRGTEYCNEIISELCKLMKIDHFSSTPYHHESVGTIERNHRVLNEYFRAYLESENDKWGIYLNYFTFCFNITQNSSNNNIYSPFELVFGRRVNLPSEFMKGRVDPVYNLENYVKTMKYMLQTAHEKTSKLIEKMKLRNKAYFDRKAKPLECKINDSVVVEIQPYDKLKPKYKGPYRIIDIQDSNVILENGKEKMKIHKDRVKVAKTI